LKTRNDTPSVLLRADIAGFLMRALEGRWHRLAAELANFSRCGAPLALEPELVVGVRQVEPCVHVSRIEGDSRDRFSLVANSS